MDPPYEFAPYDRAVLLVLVEARALNDEIFWKRTLMPLAFVVPHVLLLLRPLVSLLLQAYEPTWKENDPPYTFAPNEADPLFSRIASHDSNRAVSNDTLKLRTTVSPTAATASPLPAVWECTDEYAPMCNDTAPP